MADLFNGFDNPVNNAVNPDFAPCVNAGDSTYLEFFSKESIGITTNKEIQSKINFVDFQIPINSYAQETKILKPGEISYISGVAKGLMKEVHIFPFPNLNSNNTSLDKYFMKVDASISYFQGFTDYNEAISTSANYPTQLGIEAAINNQLDSKNIPLSCTYNKDYLKFEGTQPGVDIDVENVYLTLIDSSVNPKSPFDASIVNGSRQLQSFVLSEDESNHVPSAKYPNGGFRGIVLKAEYPKQYNPTYFTHLSRYTSAYTSREKLMDKNKWFYIHQTKTDVTYYEPVEITPIKDVSMYYVVTNDSSSYSFIGATKSVFDFNFDVSDANCNVDPISSNENLSIYGTSVTNEIIDASTLTNVNIIDCSVTDSSIIESYGFSSLFEDGDDISSTIINDSSLNDIISSDSSIYYSDIDDSSLNNNYLNNTDVTNVSSSDNIYDHSFLGDSYSSSDEFLCTTIDNTFLLDPSAVRGSISDSSLYDASMYQVEVLNSLIDSSSYYSYLEDSLLYNVRNIQSNLKETYIEDASIVDSQIINGSIVKRGIIEDSSIRNSFIEEDVSIHSSFIDRTWFNAQSDSQLYKYWSKDDSDASAWRCNIMDSAIWDASINNTNIYDSSVYNTVLSDVSTFNCTLVNCDIINVDKDASTLNILLDPSISCEYIRDDIGYYIEKNKKLNVGAVQSTEKIIGAKDYLSLINERGDWSKVGEFFAWTQAPDMETAERNYLNGMYIYNPHDFTVKVNYILIG